MDNETIQRINDLKSKINRFSLGKPIDLNIQKYIVPALGIAPFLLLILFRPTFIYKEYVRKNGSSYHKFCYKKYFMFSLIFSIMLVLGYYGYNYNKKKHKE